jgi:hypothetical protein
MKVSIGVAVGIVLLAAGFLVSTGYNWYAGPPGLELRWANAGELKATAAQSYLDLVAKNDANRWVVPNVTVYSAPYSPPAPQPLSIKDLSDNGQAHAIDVLFRGATKPENPWQNMMNLVAKGAKAADDVDPYRANRILIANVSKGLDTLPGERILWTRVFIEPINFEFAGYTIAATDNQSIKIASVETSTDTRLSIKATPNTGIRAIGTPEVSQDSEKSQKATADVKEQYENLGIDIQPDFLRIIRESAPGGDVVGNTSVQLSMVTDPARIWCEKSPCEGTGRMPFSPGDQTRRLADDQLVLLVSSAHLADDETNPRISVLPQFPLPHCPLRAKVWMLYEIRKITKGRANYTEGLQKIVLEQNGYDAKSADVVPADDIAPAVWSIKVTKNDGKTPVTDSSPSLTGQSAHGNARKLVFTDYLTASELAHYLKGHVGPENGIKTLTFHFDESETLTPFKHTSNDCQVGDAPGTNK